VFEGIGRPVLWRRLDRAGHESARLERLGVEWNLSGAAVFAHEQQACRLDYSIVCDAAWRTVSAAVHGWVGSASVEIELRVDAQGSWRMKGREQPDVAGCIDVDLNFSPSTNLLPIRRLQLAVGQRAAVRAAWLRFPQFDLVPLDQQYERLDERTYRYESAGGAFVTALEVDDAGFATRYAGVWEREF